MPARAVTRASGRPAPDQPDWVRRATTVLLPDPRRVITKLLLPGREIAAGGSPGGVVEDLLLTGSDLPNPAASRAGAVIDRVLAMPEQEVADTLRSTLRRFAGRHHDLHATFVRHFALVADRLLDHPPLSTARRDLIGAYCTQEFSVESAALFNPSIVAHPDQSGAGPGEVRFVMSVRAVGEGHICSIEFRTGVLSRTGDLRIDDPGRRLVTGHAQAVPSPAGTDSDSYQLDFPAGRPLSERVIYPVGATESHGVEDARFVRFVEDDGTSTYYATYTAYDGSQIASRRLQTDDFRTFCSTPMLGPAARNKGMALFPRRVNGDFVALSRWDGQNICVGRSPDGQVWGDAAAVHVPTQPWELVQLGNCGSPTETADGWLVLTHGVGPMRTYQIGALLLDLDDPTQVIGALREPVLVAEADERDGYVPNVVYSCGALRHEDTLLLPYGCSDSSIRFAFVDLTELAKRVRASA